MSGYHYALKRKGLDIELFFETDLIDPKRTIRMDILSEGVFEGETLWFEPDEALALSAALAAMGTHEPTGKVADADPCITTVGHKDGKVILQSSGNRQVDTSFTVFSPKEARDLGQLLMLTADRAEGKTLS